MVTFCYKDKFNWMQRRGQILDERAAWKSGHLKLSFQGTQWQKFMEEESAILQQLHPVSWLSSPLSNEMSLLGL
jgi:hypothetical protein